MDDLLIQSPGKAESRLSLGAGESAANNSGKTPEFSTRPLAVNIGLSIAVVLLLAWITTSGFNRFSARSHDIADMQRVSGDILRLDEVLTMSAKMAAATGDGVWIDRYNRAEPLLDQSFQHLKQISQRQELEIESQMSSAANEVLIELEAEALVLVRKGKLAAAREIMSNEKYEAQKEAYQEGMRRQRQQITLLQERTDRERTLWAANNLIAFAVSLVILLLLWLRYTRQQLQWRHMVERHWEEHALTDQLTGLPNRSAFSCAVEELLADDKLPAGVIHVDINQFSRIQDAFDPDSADGLLRDVSQRFLAVMPRNATLARAGDDEFWLCCPKFDEASLEQFVNQMQQQMADPFLIGESQVSLTARYGIALLPEDAKTANDAMRYANAANRRSQGATVNTVSFYRSVSTPSPIKQLRLENRLREAIERRQLQVEYQPLVCLLTHQVIGVEALVRWFDDVLGNVSPAEFIPLAETLNLTGPLAHIVFNTALKDAQEQGWAELPPSNGQAFTIALNCSSTQLEDAGFMSLMLRQAPMLVDHGVRFELEITERVVMSHSSQVVQNLNRLAEAGYGLSIDDFGTGYSSLNYLKKYPFHKVKIDRGFVKDVETDPASTALCEAIVGMASALNMVTVAEGLETIEQVSILSAVGADVGQGYYFSKSMPADQLCEWISQLEKRGRQTSVDDSPSTVRRIS